MRNEDKSKAELIEELVELRRRVAELETTEAAWKQAEAALQQRNRELEVLNCAGQAFNSSLDLDVVLKTILEEIRPMLGGVTGATTWLIDPATTELICRQASGPQGESIRGWRLQPGQGIAGWVARHSEAAIISDTLTDERHFKGIDRSTGLEIRSMLNLPLITRGRQIGVLQVVDTLPGRFDQVDLKTMEALAATAASAIDNARLYAQAQQDAESRGLLLQEINHRVKNNLAAIVGMLSLERHYVDPANQAAYETLRQKLAGRVRGLSTVHNLLSESGWTPLRLDELARQIISMVLQNIPSNKYVVLEFSGTSPRVSPDQAHNLGLIINELATNAINHGWSGPSSRLKITVGMTIENDKICLEFRDNGPGYPEGLLRLDPAYGRAGFKLIRNIVRANLGGNLSLANDGGAVAIIQFGLAG